MGRSVSQWIFSNLLSLVSMYLSICTRDSGTDGGGAGPGVRSKSAPLLLSPGWGGIRDPQLKVDTTHALSVLLRWVAVFPLGWSVLVPESLGLLALSTQSRANC